MKEYIKDAKFEAEKENAEKSEDGGSDKGEKNGEMPIDSILKSGSVTTNGGGARIQTMTVIGQIEGHYLLSGGQKSTRYEHMIPMLVSVEDEDDFDGLLMILNTMGGDVEAGLAIAELVASMHKPTVSLVLGGGHSIGIPLAVAAKRSFIVPSATMTVHPVRTNGLVISAPQTYYYFDRMQDRIVDFVASHSGISAERFRTLLLARDEMATDIGTILEGKEAVSEGLIDELGGLSEALTTLRQMVAESRGDRETARDK